MSKEVLLKLLDDEVEWCLAHPDTLNLSKDFQEGVVVGLKQAKNIVTQAFDSMEQEPKNP